VVFEQDHRISRRLSDRAVGQAHRLWSFAADVRSPPTGNIEAYFAGRLLLIDVGMSSAVNDSTGELLRVDHPGQPNEQASIVDPSGKVSSLDLTAP
jgi:hypothetical protein